MNPLKKTPIGVEGLDLALGRGAPRGSLLVLAGRPGCGKTILAAKFLMEGAKRYGEKGVYVAFAEGRDQLARNICDHMKLSLAECPLNQPDKVRILDMLTVTEKGVPVVLNEVIREIDDHKAKRLVVDSFSALSLAFKDKIETRSVLHNILGKIVKNLGCTTLLVLETETAEGMEEYVADGIVVLRKEYVEGRLLRILKVEKMRGARVERYELPYTLDKGFTITRLFTVQPPIEKRSYKPIADSKEYYSTGIEDLDRLLGGGYPKGSNVLFEFGENVPTPIFINIITVINFLQNGNTVLGGPSQGIDAKGLYSTLLGYLEEDLLNSGRLKLAYYGSDPPEPYMLKLEGVKRDLDVWKKTYEKMRVESGRPVLVTAGVDTIEAFYSHEPALFGFIGEMVAKVKSNKDLRIVVAKPGSTFLQKVADSSDIHLKIIERDGCLFLYGKKPSTILHNIEATFEKGHPQVKLTPIV